MLSPLQIEVSLIAWAIGIDIVSEFVLKQPVAEFVSVSVYMVLTEGLTVGLYFVEVNPVGELVHEYTSPETAESPIETDPPEQIAVLAITWAPGSGFTVTTTESFLLQPAGMLSFR